MRRLSTAFCSLALIVGACSSGPQPQPTEYAEPIFTLERVRSAESVDPQQATEALDLFDEVRAMTWRLLHPRVSP